MTRVLGGTCRIFFVLYNLKTLQGQGVDILKIIQKI